MANMYLPCKQTTHLALFKAGVSKTAARLAGLGACAVGIGALQQEQQQQQDKLVSCYISVRL
jgi:hypothetical protein